MTGNPMVSLNRAVAVALLDGPRASLVLLDDLSEQLNVHRRRPIYILVCSSSVFSILTRAASVVR